MVISFTTFISGDYSLFTHFGVELEKQNHWSKLVSIITKIQEKYQALKNDKKKTMRKLEQNLEKNNQLWQELELKCKEIEDLKAPKIPFVSVLIIYLIMCA